INSLSEFIDIIDTALLNIKIKIIPNYQDILIIGDLMHSRMENPKVLFFMGLSSSNVPKKSNDNSIIDDEMRNIFYSRGIELSQNTIETTLNQKYYLYLSLSSPSEKLFLSYSSKDESNNMDDKSTIISEIEDMFIFDNNITIENDKNDSFRAYSMKDLYDYITDNFMKILNLENESIELIKNDKISINQKKDEVIKLLSVLKEKHDKNIIKIEEVLSNKDNNYLSKESLKIYDGEFNASISRIETYFNCPYKHFLQYSLELNERKECEIRKIDLGSIYHKALDMFFIKINKNKIDFNNNNEVEKAIEDTFNEIISSNDYNYLFNTKISYFILNNMKKVLKASIFAIREQLSFGCFTIAETEKQIINKMTVVDNKSNKEFDIKIKAKVDRIDLYNHNDDTIMVNVIDYKSGSKKLDIEDIESGISLQLIFYLDRVIKEIKNNNENKENINIIPSSALYFYIKDCIINLEPKNIKLDKIINSHNLDLTSNYIMNGIYNKDTLKYLLNSKKEIDSGIEKSIKESSDVVDKNYALEISQIEKLMDKSLQNITLASNQILNGDKQIKPFKKNGKNEACKYCKYKTICKYIDTSTKEDDNE
ncbi:MAG: PD-(D/E)XK nuclease family protein, partial [Eubacteriales bacterium]|nr:PD-(D/E)XK nuclease family protein [Eubacteriales bacterium]